MADSSGEPSPTATPGPTATASPTGTPTPTASPSPTATSGPTPTPTESSSPTGTPTPTSPPAPSPTPSGTPSPTWPGTPSPTWSGSPSPTWSVSPSPYPYPYPSPSPEPQPTPTPGTPGGQVQIDWASIRGLARLFDDTGDDVVALHRGSTSLAATSDLVGGDDDGRAFAEWYSDGYDSLTDAMKRIADRNFSSAGNFRDLEKLWTWLETEIVNSLPSIPDVGEAPIPQAPPLKEGA
ncbi:hypothetical protein [Nonomuraea sp. NPDC049695]|uniref:hypothetical protein n=1 Tax=Nonomuraea sp. NPDC049695 TaxID=3154734 RepID=UPI003439A37D